MNERWSEPERENETEIDMESASIKISSEDNGGRKFGNNSIVVFVVHSAFEFSPEVL